MKLLHFLFSLFQILWSKHGKWKTKNVVVLDVRSVARLEAFWIKQDMLFLHISNILGVCRGMCVQSLALYAEAWGEVGDEQTTQELASVFFFFSSKHVVFFLLGFSINLKPHWSRLLFPSLQTILNGDRGCFCLCKYAPKVIFLVAAHVLNCTFLKSFCV